MQILLTNDDGYNAPGLQTLYQTLLFKDIWDISIVAPEGQRSATGHAITLFDPIRVEEHLLKGSGKGFAVYGTPSDCVKLAIQAEIVPRPDLVISGINSGQNLGTDVFYSGTVSAALEGILLGVPAIAVSLTDYKSGNFGPAAEYIAELIIKLLNKPKLGLLNINIPACTEKKWRGVRITKLGKTIYNNVFESRIDPRGRRYFWQSGVLSKDEETDTDLQAIQEGYISITPMLCDLTDYAKLNNLEEYVE